MDERTKATVEIVLDELPNRIRAEARLRMPDGTNHRSVASAWFSGYDDHVAEHGEELAVARALSALVHQMRRRPAYGGAAHTAA